MLISSTNAAMTSQNDHPGPCIMFRMPTTGPTAGTVTGKFNTQFNTEASETGTNGKVFFF
jgi:hypothetical protein